MNKQNNDAAISETDLDKVSGGWCFFGGYVTSKGGSTPGRSRVDGESTDDKHRPEIERL